ncbi:MAG: hypothetical protein GDA56_14905 [Hormoscilla sp. GM7CHS1pb]|nr:hypothetical protein [Hormoscilla sp. GM7CHS1pb]
MGRSPMAFLCNRRSPLGYRYMGDRAVASFFGRTRLRGVSRPLGDTVRWLGSSPVTPFFSAD